MEPPKIDPRRQCKVPMPVPRLSADRELENAFSDQAFESEEVTTEIVAKAAEETQAMTGVWQPPSDAEAAAQNLCREGGPSIAKTIQLSTSDAASGR